METSEKQKPPSCSPSETFEWHTDTHREKVLKRVDKHDSAEMLERGWLDKCPPADRGFSFERTSSGVIEAHSWQVLRPLVTKALTNGNSPTYFLRASSNGFSGWVGILEMEGVKIGSIDTRLLTGGPPSDSRYFPCHSLPSDWGETNKHLPALGAERNVWNKSGIVWDFAS